MTKNRALHYPVIINEDNFNELFLMALKALNEKGEWTKPRGFKCKELLAPQLILSKPKNCLITLKDRKLNYAYLIIEKMMYLSQNCDPAILIAYNKQLTNYTNERGGFDAPYGPRIGLNNQLEYCYEELKKDPDTRRAVVTIHNAEDCRDTKDSACTLSWQFIIRNGELDMIATMRSNDILWGTCLDIPAFCFIQEVMACWLEIPMGNYIHNAASLHYYDTTEKQLNKILTGDMNLNFEEIPVWDISEGDTAKALTQFWIEEENIRKNGDMNMTEFDVINQYLFRILRYWTNKNKKKL